MEWTVLLTSVSIVLNWLPQMGIACVGTDCQALRKRSVPIIRKTRSDSTRACPENCHCDFLYFIVNCVDRGLLEIPTQASILQHVKTLDLSSNQITQIRSGAFSNMKYLDFLQLAENRIRKIKTSIFKGLSKLRYLNMSHNLIKYIPKNAFSGADVTQEGISNLLTNKLESINGEILLIDLSHNRITHISQDAFKGLTNLHKLYLYNNLLTSVSWVIGNANSFQSLEWLEIGANHLKTLPTTLLDSLPYLHTLILEPNPWICDRSLKLVYETLTVPNINLSSWSCKNPLDLTQTIKVADLNNDTLQMFALAQEGKSQASPGFGYSQSPLVITGFCTGIVVLVRWSVAG
ncbi:leucine-rich repeat-containing protein 4b [Plakobranchus ocellatus]|uniref:Leucine-rich repeat-containing protein 4b n=1 Tax=Plakobranchus ocellatus TaxID=259542 RepID=A0AAV4A2P4_9GAST|nr:leucine-rich repeat-containing protein 4b [Plakobranchus ocellatus]